jgi:hypothetical protein
VAAVEPAVHGPGRAAPALRRRGREPGGAERSRGSPSCTSSIRARARPARRQLVVPRADAARGHEPELPSQGSTVEQQPAIFAWQTLDAAFSYVETSALGGRVIVAQRATALEPGWWHYEFAVHNQNATDAVRSCVLPIGGNAVRNVGFHDVEHHSGDGIGDVDQDGTDWTWTLATAG